MKEKKLTWVQALDRKVLVVALEGEVNDWSAYIGAVEGNNHSQEWQEVARTGTKLDREIAEILFPYFKQNFKWRY